eukprot:TRINITY_DN362_c0_g1_i1.p1 TRINITY_DN362_c0_g1~~TRINITY_DN362_c0_g1_i1.p1  ORF type:complete len:892 (+),score=252.19 TRINITY_DN362_c0_g1_i1:34-2676(+)
MDLGEFQQLCLDIDILNLNWKEFQDYINVFEDRILIFLFEELLKQFSSIPNTDIEQRICYLCIDHDRLDLLKYLFDNNYVTVNLIKYSLFQRKFESLKLILEYQSFKNTIKFLEGHSSLLTCVTASEKFIATGSKDHSLIVYNDDFSPLHRFQDHTSDISDVSISPDGKYIATCSFDKSIFVYDSAEWDVVFQKNKAHLHWIFGVAFSPNMNYLVSVDRNGILKIWDFLKDICLLETRVHNKLIHSVVFSANGRYIATTSRDGTAKVIVVEELLKKQNISDFSLSNTFPLSSNNRYTGTGTGSGLSRNASTSSFLPSPGSSSLGFKKMNSNTFPASNLSRAISSTDLLTNLNFMEPTFDSKFLKNSEDPNILTIDGISVGSHSSICFSKNDRFVLITLSKGKVDLWDCIKLERIHTFKLLSRNNIVFARFIENDTAILCGSQTGEIIYQRLSLLSPFVLSSNLPLAIYKNSNIKPFNQFCIIKNTLICCGTLVDHENSAILFDLDDFKVEDMIINSFEEILNDLKKKNGNDEETEKILMKFSPILAKTSNFKLLKKLICSNEIVIDSECWKVYEDILGSIKMNEFAELKARYLENSQLSLDEFLEREVDRNVSNFSTGFHSRSLSNFSGFGSDIQSESELDISDDQDKSPPKQIEENDIVKALHDIIDENNMVEEVVEEMEIEIDIENSDDDDDDDEAITNIETTDLQFEARLMQANSEIDDYKSQLYTLQNKLEEQKTLNEEATFKIDEKKLEITELLNMLKSKEEELNDLRSEIQQNQDKIAEITLENSNLLQEKGKFSKECEHLNEINNNLNKKSKELNNKLKELNECISVLQQSLSDQNNLEEELSEIKKEYEKLSLENERNKVLLRESGTCCNVM